MTEEIYTYRPLLWVLPEDIWRIQGQLELGSALKPRFGCDVWPLDENRSLAISFRDLAADRGVPQDIRRFEELTYPLFRFLNHYLIDEYGTLNVALPGERFCCQVLNQPKEGEKRYCMHMTSKFAGEGSLAARVFATQALKPAEADRLRDFLARWLNGRAAASSGETLTSAPISLERFTADASDTAYARDGFQFVLRPYTPVTWPWLELYLSARRTFPKRLRPSFEFAAA